jgi:hypothetical protein
MHEKGAYTSPRMRKLCCLWPKEVTKFGAVDEFFLSSISGNLSFQKRRKSEKGVPKMQEGREEE